MNNPLFEKSAREQLALYPQTLRNVFSAVNAFAYEACHTIEGPLGEGRGGRALPFSYERLTEATKSSIESLARDKNHYIGRQLRNALAEAALTDSALDRIVEITRQEALARIDNATSADKTDYREHGHHGRQYIARNTVMRVMKDVLPLKP